MKENNNKTTIRVTEGHPSEAADVQQYSIQSKFERLRKPLIFGLMGIVFSGCIYLIFKPSQEKKAIESAGLNDAVPQATGAGLPEDKGKAYEQEMLERKEQEKLNNLTTLSDYWNSESAQENKEEMPEENESSNYGSGSSSKYSNPAVHSYRNAQNALGSFYQNDNSETLELRRQLDDLKEKLAQKDIPAGVTASDQLALMEKSYQMAAKYLPSQPAGSETSDKTAAFPVPAPSSKNQFTSFVQAEKNVISALHRESLDSTFYDVNDQNKNHGFYTASSPEQTDHVKNSIKACVERSQTITGEGTVRLRLMEAAKIPSHTIASGTIITASGKIQTGRLQLKVSSIEIDGSIIPVDLTIYDLDGQQGLYVPYSAEMNALNEIAGNMSQNSGTSIMMTQSAGQQAAADLSRGAVQGISGYFSKKVRTPKVTLKAGHQVFLVSKK